MRGGVIKSGTKGPGLGCVVAGRDGCLGKLAFGRKGRCVSSSDEKVALRRSGRRGIGRVTRKGFGLGCVVTEGDVCLPLVPREQDGLRSKEKGSGGEEVVVEKCRLMRSSG